MLSSIALEGLQLKMAQLYLSVCNSFDNRGRSPQHWSNASVLAARASFRIAPRATEPGPPEGSFRLAATGPSDGGLYRCRVDYRRAKTTTSEVELRVIGES